MKLKLTTKCAVILAASALILTGCAQGNDAPEEPASPDTTTNPDTSADATNEGLETAKELVNTYSDVVDGFVPTNSISGADSLSGSSIMYIPAVAAIPYFATSFKAAESAFEGLGVSVDLCDAQANPSNMSSCFNQVITQNYAGVIVDSVDPSLALEAFNEVAQAGIPVVVVNVNIPEGSPETVQGFSGPNVLGQRLSASAIIADSEGEASVVGVKVIDHAGTIFWWEEGTEATYAELCDSCSLSVVEIKTSDLQNLPPKVSAALLQNPDAEYVQPQLSPETVPTLQGATDAARTDVKGAVAAATLADLQQIASDSGLQWAVGWDNVRMSWLATDILTRLLLEEVVDASEYTVEPRIFNAENIDDLDVTQDGWDNSDWFGGTSYQDELRALWGVQ